MGLDMYLYKKTYVKNWEHMSKTELHEISVKRNGIERTDIKTERISDITEQVGYWRKFNALHKWFVDNCQDGEDKCQESYVSMEKLKELLNVLKEVENAPVLAGNILPTSQGFFFGGSNYDEYYYNDVKETITLLTELLKEEGNYYYHASW